MDICLEQENNRILASIKKHELNLIVGQANELRTIFVILIGEQKLL